MYKTIIMNKNPKIGSERSLVIPSIKKYNSMVERSVSMTFLIPLFNS